MYIHLAEYVGTPEGLKDITDETLLDFLRQGVTNVFNEYCVMRGHQDPSGLRTVLSEVFTRCAREGLDFHPLFLPVALAMSDVPVKSLHQDRELAHRLALAPSVYENPWKRINGGKSDLPSAQYYDIR